MADWVDAQGQAIVVAHAESAGAFDRTVAAYLGSRVETRDRLRALLESDPACVLGHCLDGYLHMLSSRRTGFRSAVDALGRAVSATGRTVGGSRRERLHLGALAAWSRGDLHGALKNWDGVLADYPRDLVALKVSQFVLSYLGESARMRETVERVLPAWDASVPGFGFALGCHAYALEETGDYANAEATGRRAVEIDPTDIWAAHAVAHVTEMQGRLHDGISWISALSDQWTLCNNFALHLRWHEALLHLDLEDHARVLELYDRAVRRHPSDEYLDVTNAVSLLWRLEQANVNVGTRWAELAEHARGHVDDHALVFVDLHYLMAVAAAGGASGADQFLTSCEQFAAEHTGTEASVMAQVGLPMARAVLAHRRGAYGEVVDLLMPVRHQFKRVGGSHAQRDVFDMLLIDAACRAPRLDAAAELLAERTTRRPGNIWGWKEYANVLGTLASPGAADASRRLDHLRSHAAQR